MSFTPEELEQLQEMLNARGDATTETILEKVERKAPDPKKLLGYIALASMLFGAIQFGWGKAEAIATADETKAIVQELKEGFEAEGDLPAAVAANNKLLLENSMNDRRYPDRRYVGPLSAGAQASGQGLHAVHT